MTDEQLYKLELLKAQSDENGGKEKARTSNFILYRLYSTAVMDAVPDLLEAARENAALRREVSEAWQHAADWAHIANKRPGRKDHLAEQWLAMKAREAGETDV